MGCSPVAGARLACRDAWAIPTAPHKEEPIVRPEQAAHFLVFPARHCVFRLGAEKGYLLTRADEVILELFAHWLLLPSGAGRWLPPTETQTMPGLQPSAFPSCTRLLPYGRDPPMDVSGGPQSCHHSRMSALILVVGVELLTWPEDA